MDFKDLAQRRYSARSYQSTPVDRELLLKVIGAALLAPSAVNFQPWKFLVVTDPELLDRLHGCYHREWFKTAPACIVAIGDHDKGWHRPTDDKDFTDIDVAIAVDHLMLAATEIGLGTCWICHFNVEKCAEIFDLPGNFEPIAMIPIGYPASIPIPDKKRKTVEQTVLWNKFEA
ncbi:MAG: nitroreductase family protein [Prolixibacteraceae bacterium]|jgi:nitroreductase|nr:nitroreductase family protein [Prolixibacteraceae bacterium]